MDIKYTEISAQYNNHWKRIYFSKIKCKAMPEILVNRFKVFGEVIYSNPGKFISLGEHYYIIYEGDVEMSKSDENKLTLAIYKHVKKCVKNSEAHVKNQVDDLNNVKDGIEECFAKLILNKKLKKIK